MPIRNYIRNISGLDYLIEQLKIETDECQEWPFCRNRGYGYVFVNGKRVRVHRQALRLTLPDFDESLHALHHCDNPPCFNPRHLFQGTDADNIHDKIAKGRAHSLKGKPNILNRGEGNGNAVLTAALVREIRKRYASGQKQKDIAKETHTSRPVVSRLVRNLYWKNV